MAVGRTAQHRFFKPGAMHRTNASRHVLWRAVVLICAAALAVALTTYSLIVDPPDTPPASSYLP
jgi:hypothetical protein